MYQSYYPIGTAGHRASSLFSHLPHAAYYGNSVHPAAAYAPPPPYGNPAVYAPPAAVAANEPVTGGINSVLEYEPQNISAFVCWCAFGMLNQNRNPSKDFEKVMVSILYATRLPKSTIIIALEYLNQRYSSANVGRLSELDIFLRLVVALVLANKFNDDNTFTNRSWCGATGLAIDVLNSEEAAWLCAVNWQLNVVKFQPNIKTLEECWATWLARYCPLPVLPQVPAGYCASTLSPENLQEYSSLPSSPMYEPSVSSRESSTSGPGYSSPIRFSQDWVPPVWAAPQAAYQARSNQYVPLPHQSIWSYTPPQYQYVPQMNEPAYYGYANPYYHCSMASC